MGNVELADRKINILYSGNREDFQSVATLCGMTLGQLEMTGIRQAVRMYLDQTAQQADGRTLPFMIERFGEDVYELAVCPIAYRLSREMGIDPARRIALSALNCIVAIGEPCQPSIFESIAQGEFNDVVQITDGMAWVGGRIGTDGRDDAYIQIHRNLIDYPDTVYASLAGLPLKQLVRHDSLPDLTINDVVHVQDGFGERCEILFDTVPRHISLGDAERKWRAGSSSGN